MASRVFLSLCLLLSLVSPVLGREAREQSRIDFLLTTIGSLPGAKFIRNGSEYDASKAKEHLQQKLDYGGEKIKTAEQFVEYCATKSSLSGQAYRIRLSDGKTVDAGPFLRAKLAEYDKTHP